MLEVGDKMQAIILAAGMGKRLKDLTADNTKCMVKVNGITLIERMLRQIDRQHLSRIVIVVGYEDQKLINYIATLNINTRIIYVHNAIYFKTNNIYSLALAREWLCKDDTLLFESDIIFEDTVLERLINNPQPTLALVAKYESWMDGTCLLLDNENIIGFVEGKKLDYSEKDLYYKTVNVYKFSREFSERYYVPFLEAYSKAFGDNEYYEQVLKIVIMLGNPEIKACKLGSEKWYEIDDIQDLNIAESLFAKEEERVKNIQKRYGGYWRYPDLLDFCYLVNPYFPSAKMLNEIKANFDTLVREYPSGMYVNSLLAGKNFGIHQDNIVIGNGAAELIKSLMNHLKGKMGFIRPTFDEYINRYDTRDSVYFMPENNDFSYDENNIITYFSDKEIKSLLLINPDNPSGNYINKRGLYTLIDWSKERQINLIIDESFVDFSNELDSSLLSQCMIKDNKHLIIIKSISKSYGVPGLRLGVLASGNTDMIKFIKKDIAIWNINSFGEFYMQIAEKYKNEYQDALRRVRDERAHFSEALSKIAGIRIIPSQANYIMAEILNYSSEYLTRKLLVDHNILIKDLSSKINNKEYVRLAVRGREDNERLIKAIGSLLV